MKKTFPWMEDFTSVTVVEALSRDVSNEQAVSYVSRMASDVTFSTNFVSQGGTALLLRGLQEAEARSRNNHLRALTILIEHPWTHKAILVQKSALVNQGLYVALLNLIMSDTVLIVSRALHLLSKFTDTHLANREALFSAFSSVSALSGRSRYMSCLRPAFVGIALVDASIYGLEVAGNMMVMDCNVVHELEEASVCASIFPLCENSALAANIAKFQLCMCRAYQKQAAIAVDPELSQHLELLQKLWNVTNKPFPGKSSPEWKQLGFQCDAPASDFRSMGAYALELLVFFVETCPTEARMIFQVQNEAGESECYYPVATAGIIVASLILDALETRSKAGQTTPVILNEGMGKIWVAVFRHIDTVFVERKLSYLQFGELTKCVTIQLSEALAQNPLTSAELSGVLKAADESSPTILGVGKKRMARSKVLSTGIMTIAHREKDEATTPRHAGVPKLEFNNSAQKPKHHQTKMEGKKLRRAAQSGDAKKVIEILGKDKEGAYTLVNDPEPDTRLTPLHFACIGGHADCVTLLCGAGAALECVASALGTPLHCVCDKGIIQIVIALLDGGAKINSSATPNGRTPLMIASSRGYADIVELLIERGADISTLDAEGNAAADYWVGNDTMLQSLGERRKRASISLGTPLIRSNSLGARAGDVEQEIQILKAENEDLRSMVQDLTRRVEALEKKTPREKSREKKTPRGGRDKLK